MNLRRIPPDRAVESFVPRQKSWNDIPAEPSLILGKVTGSTAIAGGAVYRWEYDWEEATITGTTPGTKTDGIGAQKAFSVSELSNTATPTTYAYGVPSGDLPAGFVPKAIPTGTFVMLSAFRKSDGTLIWLIINTQAISGTCP